ncbi:hypothetical protein K456DRAFT_38394 [Colletotrichum gloeosporioides 23]|nr:hypothetical protein K456DRAFT_38394 [Colletotrichum gloeosporioides 23]
MAAESSDVDQHSDYSTDGMWEFLKQKAVSPTAEIFSEYEGDLTLVVGPPPQPDDQPGQDTLSVPTKHESRRVRVDSKTMATVSDVFDCMLFGGFAESKSAAEPWIVSLPDDNPWAMCFIVATAHGYSSYIPECLGTDELQIVLHLIDKYAVKPILAGWLQKWISECPDHQSLSQDVAWLIGHEKIFTDHVKASCENARIDVRGDLTDQSSLALCYYASLEGFDQEESITRTRGLFISHLIRYLNVTLSSSRVRNLCERRDKSCDAMVLGSLIEACDDADITHCVASLMAIRRLRVFGEPRFLGSVKELIGIIKTISKSIVSTHIPGCNPFHGIDEFAGGVWRKIGSPLDPETQNRLRKNAMVSGLTI